ncbi:hypothetical protein MLD38_000168 [Melastoma candidum]|uniref:Uncharacterized protein n=1 Tax=Melastoma candidum TaxID=119954 RepID=A0ACB9S954_9MYRT|nr:hypothetical protein MLD38_000168 [Melastoma candidum]
MPFSYRRWTFQQQHQQQNLNPLLPTAAAASKSKLSSRKSTASSGKRPQLVSFVLSNVLTIAILFSILFFLFTLFLFLSPTSSSSPSSRSPPQPRPILRRTRAFNQRQSVNRTIFAASFDLTTKDLYDRIEFRDLDGGPWKQGWRVTYQGDEWDEEKLKVFVVPHSHNDPGWRLTVEEYYDKQSRHILDTIVETLSKDSRRKFIWEEMSYLERWWRDASDSKRESFTNLVKSGQLEIVSGGWVMNDEANSHYYAIMEQMTEGNMWLNDTIGVIPKNSWSIDPFGYSPTMAYILRRMGFENMLIQRTHYELKKELAWNKNLEYVWRQIWDTEESTDIFVHMMPFYSYDVPHTCGPEPAVCCQFDFARMRGFTYEMCPWKIDPVETTPENVKERATLLLDQYRKKSTLYRTNTLLVPLGDDFRYVTVSEAETQFRNYQLLFDYINSNPSLNAEVKFGTLDDYFRVLRDEADRINYSRPGERGSVAIGGFPSLAGDFFTYSDREKDYWSGYYVSRPFFKAVDRVLESTLRAAEMMMALLLGYCQRAQCEKLPMGFSYKLAAARRNLAIFQHHDGVTGTAKNHVVRDYGLRMHTSLLDLQIFMSKGIEALLGVRHAHDKFDQSPSQFEPEQVRSKYDALPVHKVVMAADRAARSVIFFNSLEQTREEVVMVVVDRPNVKVFDSNWTCIPSQVSPELQHHKSSYFTGRHRLHFKVSVPAMGLQTYYISSGSSRCSSAQPATLKYFSKSGTEFSCPAPYVCTQGGKTMEIKNARQKLVFYPKNGFLNRISHHDGFENVVDEGIGMYSSSGSGAYLFKPIGSAKPIVESGMVILISEGPLMQEIYSYPETMWDSSPVSYSTRIYNSGENTVQEFVIEKEYHVEFIGPKFDDKELVVQFQTDIDNNRTFFSDLNGFQMSRREYYDKIPLPGNYYPMPSLAFIQGSNGCRFSVHSRQSLGTASHRDGLLEIMLDRRLTQDDGRGLGQGVMDNRATNVVFHILVETNISATTVSMNNPLPLSPSLLSHRVGAHLNFPMHAFIAKKSQDISVPPPLKSFSPLATSLPCDMHVVSFKVPRPLRYTTSPNGDPRFVLVLRRLHWDTSYCHRGRSGCTNLAEDPVNLFTIFKGIEVSNPKPTSLNLLHDDTDAVGYTEQIDVQEGDVVISPMEIQAYKLDLRRPQ